MILLSEFILIGQQMGNASIVPLGVCPYCHQEIYETYSSHCDKCESFKNHCASFPINKDMDYKDMDYKEFLKNKLQLEGNYGFEPIWMPDFLFDFQKYLIEWALIKGRSLIAADCGLGKTPMQLVWAENIIRKTNKNVLILTPLAVGPQTIKEGEKFGIECHRSQDGKIKPGITVTNYQRLHYFDPSDFTAVVCDESSILKNFDGVTKSAVTEFMRLIPYRLLCTATAAPNDYTELGTSSEALGYLGHMDMLTRFFRNVDGGTSTKSHGFRFKHKDKLNAFVGKSSFWRFKRHAETPFWRWICSWARAMRKPSDFGYDDDRFILPALHENKIIIDNTKPLPGYLFTKVAEGLKEERQELRSTIKERCDLAAELVSNKNISVIWCNLNDEGKYLKRAIKDSVEISGSDPDEKKEEIFIAFKSGEIKKLITKAKIAGFGLNWEHCNHTIFFASHSYEQYYQAVRRFWRFGQINPVTVDTISTAGGRAALDNLQRKSDNAAKMFTQLVSLMNNELKIDRTIEYKKKMEVPAWL